MYHSPLPIWETTLTVRGRRTSLVWLLLYLGYVLGFNQTAIPHPTLDLDALGCIAFTGDFDALMMYHHQKSVIPVAGTNEGAHFIRAQLPNGTFMDLAEADAAIKKMCVLPSPDGRSKVIVTGSFTSIDNIHANAIAMINYSTSSITPLEGLNGSVYALMCDQSAGLVYIAGDLTGGNSSNAVVWNDAWDTLPFGGFDGPVNSIVKSPTGTIIFGGSFSGFADPELNVTLNGLFEFDPNQQPFDASVRTKIAATGLALKTEATINDIVVTNNITIIAGNLTSSKFSNIFFVNSKGESQAFAAGGINGVVSTISYLADQSALLVGGNFTNTADGSASGLNNVAGYSFKNKQMVCFGSRCRRHCHKLQQMVSQYTG